MNYEDGILVFCSFFQELITKLVERGPGEKTVTPPSVRLLIKATVETLLFDISNYLDI